jgi:hypothetical protein
LEFSKAKTPYLKAMVAFAFISEKFSKPMSHAAKGGVYEDEDEYDIIMFQVEQWKKHSFKEENSTHSSIWTVQIAVQQPPWMVLLYLRANAVRCLLLRPFFFSNTPTAASERKKVLGLEIISETINILSLLNKTTDTYAKLHPHFQHILATTCALLFLIVAYAKQSRASSYAEFPRDFSISVNRSFKNATALAAAYRSSSRASRRLWKRLISLEESLRLLGIVTRKDENSPNDFSHNSSLTPSVATIGKAVRPIEENQNRRRTQLYPSFLECSAHNIALPGGSDTTNGQTSSADRVELGSANIPFFDCPLDDYYFFDNIPEV